MTSKSILWRGIYSPGHEACHLFVSQNAEWHLEGTAVFVHDRKPCVLSYVVVCEENWNTLRAKARAGPPMPSWISMSLWIVSVAGGSMASCNPQCQAVLIWISTSVHRQIFSQYAD